MYRAIKYLESRGEFITPRVPVTPVRDKYKFMKKDSYRHFTRNFYDTPTKASVLELIRKKKPDVVMLQAWFEVTITKGKQLFFNGISSGISIPIETVRFDYDEKIAELKRFAIANTRVEFDSAAVTIVMKLAKDKTGKQRLRTILYFTKEPGRIYGPPIRK